MAIEPRRGCGYRKLGGLYLVADALGEVCHRLPFVLEVCPTCNAGIKPARGWTWVDAVALFSPPCPLPFGATHCERCPVCSPLLFTAGYDGPRDRSACRAGLLWVGQRFYATPHAFIAEAAALGVSRRISTVPRGFVLGATWVLLAHQLAVPVPGELELKYRPGIFHVFKPSRLEQLVRDDTPDAELDQLRKRDITPVLVPADDADHQGSVWDEQNADGAELQLEAGDFQRAGRELYGSDT